MPAIWPLTLSARACAASAHANLRLAGRMARRAQAYRIHRKLLDLLYQDLRNATFLKRIDGDRPETAASSLPIPLGRYSSSLPSCIELWSKIIPMNGRWRRASAMKPSISLASGSSTRRPANRVPCRRWPACAWRQRAGGGNAVLPVLLCLPAAKACRIFPAGAFSSTA